MNRIQQVLQKAEQDGTTRHTRGVGEAPAGRVPRAPVLVTTDDDLPLPVDLIDRAGRVQPPPRPARTELEARPHPLLVAATAPHSPAAERYRSLRTRIAQIEHGDLRRVLMMTSPGRGEGKSMTSLNLGITMAQEFHRRVVVVDADLRRPALHALLGLPSSPGLSDVLLGGALLEDVMVVLPDYRLTVIPAGLPTEQPTELLGSTAMRRVMEQLRTQFDRVLLDTPPAVPLADAGVMSRMADAVLVVVRAGITQMPAIERTLSEIDTAKVLGLILNDAGGPETAAYYDKEAYAPLRHTAPSNRRSAGARREAADRG